MDFTVLVLTGNSVHPIRFASSLFCCSLEPLLCCETLKSVVEIFCRDAQALFALGGLSLSTEVFCNCEVEKKKRNQNLFFLSYPLPSLTRTVLLSCLCTSLLLPPITCLTLFILHLCYFLSTYFYYYLHYISAPFSCQMRKIMNVPLHCQYSEKRWNHALS